jgi:hypothetical protein
VTLIVSQLQRRLVGRLNSLARKVSPKTVVILDYPVNSRPRWQTPPYNPYLYDIINSQRRLYRSHLEAFLPHIDQLSRIPTREAASTEPYWINGWMPGLDGVALYGFMAANKPKLYLEVGSGNSTKFARKAIIDHNLKTKIMSIDPYPRAEIDALCDEIIRKPLEDVDLQIFDRLEPNDIVYIDNSHRVFMNSDAMVFFLDILPGFKPGIYVQIHDITLPYDYPKEWINRYYSEQYVLAAYLLARGNLFDIVLPGTFISRDHELNRILAPLWQKDEMTGVETHGCSFWLRMK